MCSGRSDPDRAFQYDTGTGAAGKLNRIDDATGNTVWQFDTEGRLLAKIQTTGGLARTQSYRYDPVSGRVDTVTYPSGIVFKYTYDAAGRPSAIAHATSATGPFTPLLEQIVYQPLGALARYRLPGVSGVPVIARVYDADGRISRYAAGDAAGTLVSKSLIRDRLDNLTRLGDTGSAANDQIYGYDKLNRLTDYSVASTATVHAYDYDALGNRDSKTADGATTASVIDPDSNRLASVGPTAYSHDDAGNTLTTAHAPLPTMPKAAWLPPATATLTPSTPWDSASAKAAGRSPPAGASTSTTRPGI